MARCNIAGSTFLPFFSFKNIIWNIFDISGVLDKADLVFAVDTSSNMDTTKVQKIQKLVDASLKSYQITQQLAHIGLVSFGDVARTILSLKSGLARNRIKTSLSLLPIVGGKTQLSALAKHLEEVTFNTRYGARTTSPKIAVIITEGKSDMADLAQLPIYATLLGNAGIELVIVEIGEDNQGSPLKKILDTPMNYISTRSADTLPEVYGALERRIAAVAGTFVKPFHPHAFARSSFLVSFVYENVLRDAGAYFRQRGL